MNYLEQNPDFLKRLENAVELPIKETNNGSVDYLTVGLCLLAIAASLAVTYKIFEPRIVINHYYPPKQSGVVVQQSAQSKKS